MVSLGKQTLPCLPIFAFRLTGLIKQAWLESGCVYGYRKLHNDMRSVGETCSLNRVARLASLGAGWLQAQGWLYLAVVIDLYSRRVVGWSIQSRMQVDLVLSALLMAVWRSKPKQRGVIHSDQGSQFTGHEWQKFRADHHLEASMSRRGNCHNNAVAETFFQLLKRKRIRRKTYPTRKEARDDVFDYIEMFYNPKRKHGNNELLSPVDFERQTKMKSQGMRWSHKIGQGVKVYSTGFGGIQNEESTPVHGRFQGQGCA